jgi:hypothetical protein
VTSHELSNFIILLSFITLAAVAYMDLHDRTIIPIQKHIAFSSSTPYIKLIGNDTAETGKLHLTSPGTVTKQPFTKTVDQIKNHASSDSLYHYEPYLTLSGSNHTDITSNSSLQLTKFSVAAWFRTSMDVPFRSIAFIVNKGGVGSFEAGQNMNYGIWLGDLENIRAGFETSAGKPILFVKSPKTYNLYHWHYVVVTYDRSFLRLYVDGEQVANKFTNGAIPDHTGDQPIRIGANSYALNGYYIGNVDELRIWDRALTGLEIADQYDRGIFNTTGQVLYRPF